MTTETGSMDKNLRVRLTLDAVDRMARPLRGIDAAADKVQKTIRAVNDRARALKSTLSDVDGYRAAERAISLNNSALDKARQKADALAAEWKAADAPTQKLTRSFAAASQEVARLEALQERHNATLQAVAGRLEAAGVSTDDMVRHEQRLQGELRETNAELDRHRAALGQVNDQRRRMEAIRTRYDRTQQLAASAQGAGTSAIGAGVAAGAPILLAAREAMTFEDAMADVRKVVNFDTPQAFARMAGDVQNLSERIPVASEQLAAIMAQGARAGVPRQALLAYTEAAAKMAVAFDVSSEDAGAMMATWRTAFGLEHEGVLRLANQVNALTNAHGGNAAAVAEMVTRIGPLGDVAGASSPVLAALAQVMNSVGVQSEVGATGIKNMLLGLTKGAAATKTQREAFQALGMDAAEMARRMQTDAGGAITAILERVASLSEDQQLSVLGQLFGTESVAAIAPMLSQLDLVRRNLREVGDASFYAGSMDAEYAARAATTSNEVKLATAGVKALAVEFGSALLPQIKAGSEWLRKTARGVRDFASEHPGATRVVGLLVAAVAAGLLVFGGLALAVSAVLGPFALLQFTLAQSALFLGPVARGLMMGARGALWMGVALRANLVPALAAASRGFMIMGAAALANPVTWIILAIVAAVGLLAGAAYLIYRNWGTIGPWLSKLWAGIRQTVGGALSAIGGAVMRWTPMGAIVRNWSGIVGFLGALWRLVSQTVLLGLDLVKLYVLNFTPLGWIIRNWSPITGFIAGVWNGVKAGASAAIAAVLGYVMNFTPLGAVVRNWGPITGFVGGVWSRARALVTNGIAAISGAIRSWSPLVALQAAFASTFSWLGGLPGRFLRIGTDIVNGMTAGIRGQRAAVAQASAEATRGTEVAARRQSRTQSPSRVFADIGRDLMSGMAVGIQRTADAPAGRMRSATAALASVAAIGLSPATALAGAPSPTFDTGPRIRPASEISGRADRGARAAPVFHITINAAPGQSPKSIVDELQDRVEGAGGGSGSGFFGDDGYGAA